MPASRTVRLDPAPPPFAPALTALECGQETTPHGHVFPPRRLSGAALIATVHGQASARVNGRLVEHRPGTLLAVAPDFALHEHSDRQHPWTAHG